MQNKNTPNDVIHGENLVSSQASKMTINIDMHDMHLHKHPLPNYNINRYILLFNIEK